MYYYYISYNDTVSLNSNKVSIGWTEVGVVRGKTAINYSSLKSGKTDLTIIVSYDSVRTSMVIAIPSNTSIIYHPLPGYFVSTNEQLLVTVAISNEIVQLNLANYNGTNIISEATLGLYIR